MSAPRKEREDARAVVCGSRYKDADPKTVSLVQARVWERIAALPYRTLVITGGASGVDRWADRAAKLQGYPTLVMRAAWDVYGGAAGPIRNRWMLDMRPVLVVAFWDGESSGTNDTVTEAKRRGIACDVVTTPRVSAFFAERASQRGSA